MGIIAGVATGVGALASAGSSIYGATQAGKGSNPNQMAAAGFDPYNDPVYNASQILTMMALGMPVDSLLMGASPMQQLQNAASAPNAGTTSRRKSQRTTQAVSFAGPLIGSLEAGTKTMDQVMSDIEQFGYYPALYQAAGLAGFSSIEDMLTKELDYRKKMKTLGSQANALAPIVQKGRFLGQKEIANLQGTLIPEYDAAIHDYQLPQITDKSIDAASEVERARQRESILQAANVGGFNPSAGLAEAERDTTPLANAIALLTGKQNLGINNLRALIDKNTSAQNSLDSLYKSIFGPIETANQTSAVGFNAATQNASIAGQQAIESAKLQSEAAQAKGTGTVLAGNALNSGLQSYLGWKYLDSQTQPAAKVVYGGSTPLV
jgi:hypothetical protein